MQPTDQMSMLVLYVLDPSSTSGARYQSVTTYEMSSCLPKRVEGLQLTSFEKVLTGTPNALARPKSPILSSHLRLMSRF